MFSRRNPLPGWLAVEAGDEHASFAYVRPGPRRPQVVFCETRALDPTDPRALEHAAKEFHAQRHRVTTLAPAGAYQLFVLEAPNVKPDELRAAVRWRIKDMIDFHVDDAVVDVLDIPAPESGAQRPRSMYAVVAKADTVRGVVARFERAKIPLEAIDIAETAQRNVAALYESGERAVVALAFDRDGGLLTLTRGGELCLSRRLELSLGSLCDADAARRNAAFDRALVELQRSLDHIERQFHAITVEKVLVAPLPAPGDGLAAHLRGNVNLPVAALALEDALELPASRALADAEGHGRWLRLIGAGLRNEARAL